MQEEFEKKLNIEGPIMSRVRFDINEGIQNLLTGMVTKEADEGTLTVKINFSIMEKPLQDRVAKCLNFAYKVGSAITLKDEVKNEQYNTMDEMEFVDDQWKLLPITGGIQRTVFDEVEE